MSPDSMSPDVSARRPGLIAAALAAVAPAIAFLTTAVTLLLPPWSEMPRPPVWWLELLVAAASAATASALLWRGVRRGAFSLLPLLAIAAAPWLVGLALGALEARSIASQFLGGGGSFEMLVSATPSSRVLGLLATWSLAGSVAFGLAVAALAGRPGRPRPTDIVLGIACVLPLAAFVLWTVVTNDLAPLWLEAGLLGLALWAAPIVVGLASASPPGTSHPLPADRWRVACGLAVLLAFLAAASLYRTVAWLELSRVFAAVPDAGADLMAGVREDLAAAGRFRWIGAALAFLPALVMALRGPPRARAGLVLAGAAAVATAALLVDPRAAAIPTPFGGVEGALAEYEAGTVRRAEEAALAEPGEATSGPVQQPRKIEGVVPGVVGGVEGIEGGVVGGVPGEPDRVAGGVPGGVVGGVGGAIPGGIPPGADASAVAILQPPPAWPAGVLAPGQRRVVVVEVEVGPDGGVRSARAISSAEPALADAAVSAARRARFRPAVRAGAPLASQEVLTYQFVND